MPNKDLDPDGIDKAAKICEEKGCVIVYGGLVKKINETKGESKRILIVSDTFITFVKSPMFPSLSHTRSWSDLVSVRNIDKDGLELIFKKNNKNLQFRFKSRELLVIRKKIVDVLYHTLTEVELSKIDIEFQHPDITVNPRGVFSRFDEHLVKSGMVLTDSKFREPFRQYCQKLSPNCIPKSIETVQEMKALFYALMASTFTKGLFFPEIKNEEVCDKMFKYLGFFVNSPSNIQFFSFKNSVISRFDSFVDAIIQKSETCINGIGFRDVEMPEDSVEKIKKVIGEKNFISLRWCTISPLASSESLLNDKKVRKSLRYLALDRTKGLNFRRIAPRLSHIVVLSLEHSGLEIADVFKLINKNNLSELRMINLAFNNATKPFESSTIIPPKIKRIDISHVKFENNVMKNILEVILTADYDDGLKFYCDKYHDEDQEIDDAMANFQNISCEKLLEFSWRKNKIDTNLLNFLKRCPKLEKLIFEGNVYNSEEESIVDKFAAILPSLESLTSLYVCGYKKCVLGNDFETQLLDGLKKLPKLTCLDISNNSISDQGINSLVFSLKELSNLTHIILDNNAITSLDPLMKLAEKAIQLHKKLSISWPANDIKSLLRDQKVEDSEISNLRGKFKFASEGSINLSNNSAITLDDGVVIDAKNSSSVKNKAALTGKKQKQRGGSFFIRAGSVRNIKRALAEGDERSQDPDSVFIQPFDSWFGEIDDNNFPLYLTEELVNELDVQKYDPDADMSIETDFESEEYEEEKSDKEKEKSKKIQNRSINDSNASDDDKQRATKNSKQRNSDFLDNSNRNNIHRRDSKLSDDDDRYTEKRSAVQNNNDFSNSEDDDRPKQQTKKYVKAPPSLKPADEVLSSFKRQNQKSPNSKRNTSKSNYTDEDRSSKNQSLISSSSDKINNDNDEIGEVKERSIPINQNSDEKVHDDTQSTSIKSSASQKYKKKPQKFPTPNYSQSQKLGTRSVAKTSAPPLELDNSDIADSAFADQTNEAEPFDPPSWSFPVPRVLRVSNSSFLSELNDKYSVAAVINNLRSKK